MLVIGLCGGLTETLPEERIVAYTECLSTGPNKAAPLQCSRSLTDDIVKRLQQQGIKVDRVIGITSPRIATTKADRLALAKSGATAVDMESFRTGHIVRVHHWRNLFKLFCGGLL